MSVFFICRCIYPVLRQLNGGVTVSRIAFFSNINVGVGLTRRSNLGLLVMSDAWVHMSAETGHFMTRVADVLQDPEAPIALLRNVCFMCDSNGIQALQSCFERATPETLPVNLAHLLLTLISNVSAWPVTCSSWTGSDCFIFFSDGIWRIKHFRMWWYMKN